MPESSSRPITGDTLKADHFSDYSLTAPVNVWIVEDNSTLRDVIKEFVNQVDEFHCALAVESCEEALAALEKDMVPHVVLMDLGLPGMLGQEGIKYIKAISPATRTIVLTIHEDEDRVFDAIYAGASGYLLKPSSSTKIIEAIYTVMRGGSPMNPHIASRVLKKLTEFARPKIDYGLTTREEEILKLLTDGLRMREIAEQLFVSMHTVDTHMRNIYEKLHVHSRSAAVVKAIRDGVIKVF